MDHNDDVYALLAPPTRKGILDSLGIAVDHPPADLSDVRIGSSSLLNLHDCLETLAVLADGSAATLVKAAMIEAGVSIEEFPRYPSSLERAADLWLRDKNRAKQALRWWQANVEVRKQNLVAAYSIPGTDTPKELAEAAEGQLKRLIADALGEALQPKDIRLFQISKRPSPWPGLEAEQIIQIDIKRSSDPERVEIDEEGVIQAKSLRFIVPILVVIDPVRRALYVMSKTNPRNLRQSLAMVVMQAFFGRGRPAELPKLHVHPAKLARKQHFSFPKGTPIKAVEVVSLGYRNLDEPGVRRAVVAEAGDVDLYALADLARPDGTHVVHEAAIRFKLDDRRDGSKPRTCALKQPNTFSFPHFSASDRAAAEEFLVLNGLVDPNPFAGQVGPLDGLAGMTGDLHVRRVREAFGQEWTRALVGIGVLANGPAAEDAHCAECDAYHAVQTDTNSGLQVLACPQHTRGIALTDIETFRFLPDRLAAWLAGQWRTDSRRPSEIHAGIWDLGVIAGGGRIAAIPLIALTNRPSSETLAWLSQRVNSRAAGPPGLVISLSGSFAGTKLPHGWKIASLAGLVEVHDATMSAPTGGPRSELTGRKPRTRKPDRWPELVTAYLGIRKSGLTHYQAADELLAQQEWPWGREHIARRLKKDFKGDFS